jgi:hypothetical protein
MARFHPSGLELNLHQAEAQDPEIMAERFRVAFVRPIFRHTIFCHTWAGGGI